MLMRNIKGIIRQLLCPVICMTLTATTANPAVASKITEMVLIAIRAKIHLIAPLTFFAGKHFINFNDLNRPYFMLMPGKKRCPMGSKDTINRNIINCSEWISYLCDCKS